MPTLSHLRAMATSSTRNSYVHTQEVTDNIKSRIRAIITSSSLLSKEDLANSSETQLRLIEAAAYRVLEEDHIESSVIEARKLIDLLKQHALNLSLGSLILFLSAKIYHAAGDYNSSVIEFDKAWNLEIDRNEAAKTEPESLKKSMEILRQGLTIIGSVQPSDPNHNEHAIMRAIIINDTVNASVMKNSSDAKCVIETSNKEALDFYDHAISMFNTALMLQKSAYGDNFSSHPNVFYTYACLYGAYVDKCNTFIAECEPELAKEVFLEAETVFKQLDDMNCREHILHKSLTSDRTRLIKDLKIDIGQEEACKPVERTLQLAL